MKISKLTSYAKINFDEQNYELAREKFKEINKLFPLSNEAIIKLLQKTLKKMHL